MAHPAATRELLDSLCSHFACLICSSDAEQCLVAQAVSKVMWSLATLNHTPQEARLLDTLCTRFTTLRPDAQAVSNVMWSLRTLHHRPPQGAASTWLACLLAMCNGSGRHVAPQAISNVLLACAELRLTVNQGHAQGLTQSLLQMHVSKVDKQDCCNVTYNNWPASRSWLQSKVMATAVLHGYTQQESGNCIRLWHG